MKATKNILKMPTKLALLLLLIAFQSCSTYNTKTADIESDLFNGDFNKAITGIDKNKFLNKNRNRLLYLLEKGKVEHLSGNYEASNTLFEEAYIMIEDRMTKTNAGQAIAAKFTNPMAEPYKGEDFEKVIIHYYKALNYFHLGQPAEALVEAKRINIKLYELNEKYKENKNRYSEDAFSQILQGILYESTGDINNAYIAYRNAEEIYAKNGDMYFDVPTPLQLKKDLLRTSKLMGFRDDYEKYSNKFKLTDDVATKATGEAIVFWENGFGPAKDQIVITASGTDGFFYGTYYDGAVQEEIFIPIPTGFNIGNVNAIAIPKYRERGTYYSNAAIEVNNQDVPFNLAEDIYPIAKQCLKDRMLRETIDLVARFATKKAASAGLGALGKELLGDTAGDLIKLGGDVAGAATEKADTRNWQTLPATISYIRVPLHEGENKFLIKKQGPQGIDRDTIYIQYKKGLQIVNYFDFGRTELIQPVNNSPAVAATPRAIAPKKEVAPTMSSGLTAQNQSDLKVKKALAIPAEKRAFNPAPSHVTVKSVIDNYIAASGGEDKIRNMKTLMSRTNTLSEYNGTTTKIEVVSKMTSQNDMLIQSYTNGKLTYTLVVNDNGGYMKMPDLEPTELDKTLYESIKNGNTIRDNYSVPLKDPNARLEGIGFVDKKEAYVISYKDAKTNADMLNYYDVESGLLVASSATIETTSSTSYFTDYRKVNGLAFPFKTKTVTPTGQTEAITAEIKVNEGVNATDFQ